VDVPVSGWLPLGLLPAEIVAPDNSRPLGNQSFQDPEKQLLCFSYCSKSMGYMTPKS
jgi:hypothetical protein